MEGELAACVSRARHGDRSAFERVVRLTARMVYAQTAAAVRDRDLAEDLTQETFVRAWKSLPALPEESGFVSWLLTIARHVVLDAHKTSTRAKRGGKRRAGPEAAAMEAVDARTPGPGEQAELAEDRVRLLDVLTTLPEEYRRVLLMRYLGGAGYDDIRAALGLTDGALRGLLARGMALMRERMGAQKSSRGPQETA